jgi:hypothetical protein
VQWSVSSWSAVIQQHVRSLVADEPPITELLLDAASH